MGTDIVTAANAMGRAFAGGQGAADILRERGILNLIGVVQGASIPLEEFRRKLLSSLVDPALAIVGSTDRISKTFDGMTSNLGDNVTVLSATIGDTFMPALKGIVTLTSETVAGLNDFLNSLKSVEERMKGLPIKEQIKLLEEQRQKWIDVNKANEISNETKKKLKTGLAGLLEA